MNYSNKNINVIFSIVICIFLSNNMLSAQNNCLKGCKKEVLVEDKNITFSYELGEAFGMDIDFGKNKKYKFEKVTRNAALKLKLSDLPDGYEFVFKKAWINKAEAFQVLHSARTIGNHITSTKHVPLKVNSKYTSKKSIIKFGIRKKGDTNDVEPKYSIQFLIEPLAPKTDKKPPVTPPQPSQKDSNIVAATDVEKVNKTNPPVAATTDPKPKVDKKIASDSDKKQEPVKPNPAQKNGTDTSDLADKNEIAEVLFPHNKDAEKSKKEPKEKSKKQIERERKREEKKKEESAWKKAIKNNSKKAFEEFKENFPDSKRNVDVEIALRSKILQGFPKKNASGYSINLKNVFGLTVDTAYYPFDSISYAKSDVSFASNMDLFEATVNIKNIKEEKNIEIILVDSIKKVFNRDTIKLGNHLEEPILDTLDGRIQQITFKGGKRPYRIYFLQNDIIVKQAVTDSIAWIPPPNYFEENNLYGEITFQISDSELSQPRTNDNWKLNIPKEDNLLIYYLGGGAAFLLLVVFIFLVRGKKRENKKQELTAKMKPDLEEIETPKVVKKPEIVATKKIKEGGNAFIENEDESSLTSGSKIKITGFKKANEAPRKNESELEEYLKKEKCYSFDTTIFWKDSTISKVIFSEKSIENLDKFLHEQNLSPQLKEEEGQIPEIGGILLGTPFLSEKNNTYRVLVEEFVPIDPEYHDKFQLEFSPQSMAKDLGDIQDDFPNLLLVGWFHTHPGHGLFLSRPDLRIHDTFFRELYQFAMEIDSISERLDTGFFARRKDGKVNNKKDMIDGVQWYSWKKRASLLNGEL